MTNQKKKLQKAATEFRKKEPVLHHIYSFLLSKMAKSIKEKGILEMTISLNSSFYNKSLKTTKNGKV